MKNLQPLFYFCILSLFVILGCQNKPATTSSTPATSATHTTQADDLKPEKTTVKIEEMIYESATVYAGSTDYFFKNNMGEMVKFRVSNMEENPKIKLPVNLLEPNVEEGPPGANPALVGKKMQIIFGTDNQLQEIKLVDEIQNSDIKIGNSLAEVEALNGNSFMLVGFEVDRDIAGKVTDWKGGKLTNHIVQFEVTKDLPIEEYQQIMGDVPISSNHPVMKKAGLKIILIKE